MRIRSLFARWIAVVLIVTLLMPFASAAATEDEPVSYSDLFYGYSIDYLNSTALRNYAINTTAVMDTVFTAYTNSPKYILTGTGAVVDAYTHPNEMFQLILDTFSGTNYTYQDALDTANQKVFLELLTSCGTIGTDFTESCGQMTQLLQDISLAYETYNTNVSWFNFSKDELFDSFFDYLGEINIFHTISPSLLTEIASASKLTLTSLAESTQETMEYLQAIGITLVMEEVRMSMIEDVLRHTSERSTIYEGFSRLHNQLQVFFLSYFVENYLKEEIIEEVSDVFVHFLAGTCSAAGLTIAMLRISKTVILDMLLQVPSVDDVLVQMILKQYAVEMYQVVQSKTTVFLKPFEVADISQYQDLVCTMIAATTAALEASEKLTTSDTEDDLSASISSYGDFTYLDYITGIKRYLSGIPAAGRITKTYSTTWSLQDDMELRAPSNTLSENCIYLFRGGIWADVDIYGDMTLAPEDHSAFSIHGNLRIVNNPDQAVVVPEGQSCTVTGSISVAQGSTLQNYGTLRCQSAQITPVYNRHSILYNSGLLVISQDLTMTSFDSTGLGTHHGYLKQITNDAIVQIGGSFRAENIASSMITAGTVEFIGTTGHLAENLFCHNLSISPCSSFRLLTDLTLTGHCNPHNTPIQHQGWFIDMQTGSTLAEQSGSFGNIRITGDVTLGSVFVEQLQISGNLTIFDQAALTVQGPVNVCGLLTIPAGASLIVDGNLDIYHGGAAENNGTLTCKDASIRSTTGSSSLQNNGTLTVNGSLTATAISNFVLGDTYSYLIQTSEDASIHIEENFTVDHLNCLRITGGTLTNPPIQAVEAAIDAIGVVTLDSLSTIAYAEYLYTQLSDAQKQFVCNDAVLQEAIQQLQALQKLVHAVEILAETQLSGTNKLLTVSITNTAAEQAPTVMAFLCIYDADGRFHSCDMVPLSLSPGETINRQLSLAPEQSWSIFLTTQNSHTPLTASIEEA